MTIRQLMLRAFYPVLMALQKGKLRTKPASVKQAPSSFYNLSAVLNNGDTLQFETLRGKKVLIVNTASNCGYTPQYTELQKLFDQHGEQLTILGFPANDFKKQEQGDDVAIAAFCQKNFGVSFPLMQKSVVVTGVNQNTVFHWLTDPTQNGWNTKAPVWNFSKYLINESGMLTHYFEPSVSPSGKEISDAIQ